MVVVPIGYGSVTGRSSLRVPEITTLLPVAVGVPTLTVASAWPDAVSTVWFDGQVIVGEGESITVTAKEHVPPPTEDDTVTVVVPTGKKEPEAGAAVTVPQLPLATGSPKFTIAPGLPP